MRRCCWGKRNDMDRILLSGATGFIGSHVAEALCGQGFSCVLFVRDPSRLSRELSDCCEVRAGDIRDAAALADAARGCSSAVHIAGLAADWGSSADFHEMNVRGTLNVLDACRRNRIAHAIVTGSISSYGEEDCFAIKDESYPYNSHYPYFLDGLFPCGMNRYRDSKAEATRQASSFAAEHGIHCTILEPAWVYGEREFTTGFYSYVKAVRQGCRYMPGSKTNTFHVIYVRDLAQAYALAARKRLPGIERIIIGNPRPESMHRIFHLFCAEAGLEPPRLLPQWVAYLPALLLECIATLLRKRKCPALTRGRVNMFYDSIGYSVEKASRLLGFACKHTLEEGIHNTVAWYRDNGCL
jgi:nucleoside-diphosphate-sugar epimerase